MGLDGGEAGRGARAGGLTGPVAPARLGPAPGGFAPAWLALREPADHAARSAALLEPLRDHFGGAEQLCVLDLGCGIGSTARWLAPRLAARQAWTLVDRDPALLAEAVRRTAPLRGAGGAAVTVTPVPGDVRELTAVGVDAYDLVTASALLDLLTEEEVRRLAGTLGRARGAVLLALTVTGRVRLDPADPLDQAVAAAFDAHQRRRAGRRQATGGTLAGPAAAGIAAAELRRHGRVVHVAPSPWRLGPADRGLLAAWLLGWTAAAAEQRPELATEIGAYARRRAAACAAGGVAAVVDHADLLALPSVPPG